MTLNQHNVEPSIVRRLCELSGPAIEWLISMGVEFDPAELYASGVESVPRGHKTTGNGAALRSEEHTSELQSLMRSSYAVFCLKKNKLQQRNNKYNRHNKYKPWRRPRR